MNPEKDIIVGLDIGTTKIACFIGERNENGKIKIIGFGKTESKGVERGVIKNVLTTTQSIIKAVDEASEQANFKVEEVYVGIAGQHIKSIRNLASITIPTDHEFIMQEDVDQLIKDQYNIPLNPGVDIIHIFPQSFIVDGEELNPELSPVGVAGRQLKANFHIVTGNTSNLINIHTSVNRAGLSIKGVILEPVASSYAVLDSVDMTAGVALVDIGGGTTDIAIFKDGAIRHTSVLALAGNAITNDIKEGCRIMRGQAEALKTKFGSCLPDNVSENDIISIPGIHSQPPREISMRTLAQIIKTRTDTILEQVNYEISQSNLKNDILAGIVLTGGGSMLRHIKELTEFTTKIDTRIGLPDTHLDKDTDPEIINTMYATGIGLVLYGFNQLDVYRSTHQEPKQPVTDEPEPVSEPVEPNGPANDNPLNDNSSAAFGNPADPFDGVEMYTEQDDNEPAPSNKTQQQQPSPRRRWGVADSLVQRVNAYFTKVFNNDTIRNEGKQYDD